MVTLTALLCGAVCLQQKAQSESNAQTPTVGVVDLAVVTDGAGAAPDSGGRSTRFTRVRPVLDGALTESCWREAGFDRFPGSGEDSLTGTEFAVVRGVWGLYVALRCHEPDLAQLRTTCGMRDGLFEYFRADDWVEILLDPGDTGHDYYWLIVNAAGVRTDLCCLADPDRSWNGEWQAAVGREKDAWTAEVFVPAAALNRSAVSDTWGFQVARLRINEGKSHVSGDDARTRTVGGGMYRKPGTWRKLRGMRFSRKQDAIFVSAVTMAPGKGRGKARISARVTNRTGRELALRPVFRVMRPETARGLFPHGTGPTHDVPVAPSRAADGETLELAGNAEALPGETVIPYLALFDEDHNLLHCTPDRGVTLQSPIAGPGPEFSLYTAEREVRLQVRLTEWGEGYRLDFRLRLASGAERRWEREAHAAHIEERVTLAHLPIGRHALEAELVAPDGTVSARRVFDLQRAAPPPTGEAKINRWSGCLWVDGKPYVAMGNSPMITHGLGYATNMMRELAGNGFNTIHLWGGILKKNDQGQRLPELDPPTLLTCFEAAQAAGLKVIVSIGALAQNNPESPFRKFALTDDARLELISALALLLREQPALLGYEIADEPEFFVAPEWLERIYGRIKELDPYHIVTINNCRGARSTLNFRRASDTAGIDYYPIGKWPAATVGPLTSEVVAFADYRPVKMWIQGYKIFNPRAPTPAELTMMTYSLFARGASALFYFIGKPGRDLWDAQGQCAREIGSLGQVAAAGRPKRMTLRPEGTSVYASCRKTPGAYWIIAVNEGAQPAEAELVLPSVSTAGEAEVLFEDRRATMGNGTVRDSFAPFQRHVYRIARRP